MDAEIEGLYSRAESLASRFRRGGETNYVDQAIALDRKALGHCPPGHPERSISLTWLAQHLSDRYNRVGGMTDLEEVIDLEREALELRPPRHPDRSLSLTNLAIDLSLRYKRCGTMDDLNEAIVLNREALELRPPGNPDRPSSLSNLAADLSLRSKQRGAEDLNEAIVLGREVLELCPPGHPDRSTFLSNLAARLSTRYRRSGAVGDLSEAIALNQEALELCPPGHPSRSLSLTNLAVNLSTRYKRLGAMEDLGMAIILGQEVLKMHPLGHPDRSMSLNNLMARLSTRYKRLGAVEDINETIVLGRESLELRPTGHPERSSSLNNLAVTLSTRYKKLGAMEDLSEAILFDREALELCPVGHPDRSVSLSNLASRLSIRYKRLRAVEDLNEAIFLYEEALELRPKGHPDRSTSLNNLATNLTIRHTLIGVAQDLSEAIVLAREALELYTPGHPNQPMSLNNLAASIFTRYRQLGAMEDLNEAIVLSRDALALRPLGHPDRSTSLTSLGIYLSSRYDQLREMKDLDETIALGRDAFALCSLGHRDWSRSLKHLADYLHSRFTRLRQLEDKEELFSLYCQLADIPQMLSSTDLSAAKAWVHVAEIFQHPTTLLAYESSLRLLIHHLATLPSLPQHHTVLKRLTSSLAVDAFSASLRAHSPIKAVELLEQGRGVFWSQLTRLRSPLHDVIGSGPAGTMLADKFMQLTSSIQDALDSPGPTQHDQICHLSVELQTVVAHIRELPGLSRFLLPVLFSDLQQAACDGPVIIVNASKYGCDALVVSISQDPIHIPLSITKQDVRRLSSKLGTLTFRAKSMDVRRELCVFLRQLWDKIVSPVVDVLQTTCSPQSRVWWCPTAEFSPLPLHAAAPYRRGQRSLSDLYISSYTPTLNALIRARRSNDLHSITKKSFLAIGQATAKGESELVSVGAELAGIGQRIDGLATFTRIEGQESSIARVGEELSKNEWVHFACHGIPNQKHPFESAFALHDGRLTIQQIIQCNLKNAEFAYLSACHTMVGDDESPDEVIHLASAMQFVGFRSVIGTMWAVDDGETNKITSKFYDKMKDERGRLDHTRAAFALNETMKELVDVPIDQRILYIHLGA